MSFHSILFEKIEDGINKEMTEVPDYFVDLNFGQIIDTVSIYRKGIQRQIKIIL